MSERSLHTRRIVLSALFLALALVLRTFVRTYIPLMGESGIRLSIHGIFSIMPSILFGPVYGAMTSGLTDMVGHFISPTGAWIPWLTLTAVLGGFTRGWLWIALKGRGVKALRVVLVSAGTVLVVFGAFAALSLRADGLTREFYTRTPERRAAWEAGTADGFGAFWHIESERTEHVHADGDTYWRVHEEVRASFGWRPGEALPFRTPEINYQWLYQTDPDRPTRQLRGTRVTVERYGYNDAGEWGLRRAVDIEASALHTQGFGWVSRAAFDRSFFAVGQTTLMTEFISMIMLAPLGAGGFFFLLLGLDVVLRKFLARRAESGKAPIPNTTALIVAMMVPAILVSSINTFILSQTVFTSWQLLPFWVVWLPRVLQSMATTTLNVFFVAMLLGLCERQPQLRALIRR